MHLSISLHFVDFIAFIAVFRPAPLVSATVVDQQVKWVSVHDVYISQLVPAGSEGGYETTYVARVERDGGWINGKAGYNITVLEAFYTYNGGEVVNIEDFQVLIAAPGATSWVRTHDSFIPRMAVVGGTDPTTGETTFVCRGFSNATNLIPGKAFAATGACYMPIYGEVVVTEYEILVINAFGEHQGKGN